jgi:hypothetical protein
MKNAYQSLVGSLNRRVKTGGHVRDVATTSFSYGMGKNLHAY